MLHLSPEQATQIAQQRGSQPTCSACSPYASPGWESFPGTETDDALQPLGALWLPGDDEPTLEESRLTGVDAWSPLAPISLAHHPANRCEVWACRACGKPFLRYTEYGGYYEDRRIRELDPRRIQGQP
ncbi:hypothetical protein [Malikia spinosa]|uniref:hypothetical protein n=1 Tax=Malikia spinosa TaxID=86180 RepID=UPI000A9D03DC|nr:hypothetical protein [Malikia spinosa]